MKTPSMLMAIAGVQFASTQIVSVLMRAATTAAAFQETVPWHLTVLARVATALHFPIITLVLYPRQLFPGNWILIPIAANSLLWAVAITVVWRLYRRSRVRGK